MFTKVTKIAVAIKKEIFHIAAELQNVHNAMTVWNRTGDVDKTKAALDSK